jgi:hypothetical protein
MKTQLHLLIGVCASSVALATSSSPVPADISDPIQIEAWTPLKVMETEYYIRGYRDPRLPTLRHEGHKVYRRAMVPDRARDTAGDVERAPSVAHAPLPVSAELAAELATQRSLTAEVQALQQAMAETERAMREQYAEMLRQSAAVQKLREELEAERNRLRQIAAIESTPDSAPVTSPKVTTAPW